MNRPWLARVRWWHLLAAAPIAVAVLAAAKLVEVALPAGHDAPTHMFIAVKIAEMFRTVPSIPDAWQAMRPMFHPQWPPLMHMLAAACWAVWSDVRVFDCVSLALAVVTMGLMFAVIRRGTGDPAVALAGVLALCADPNWMESAVSFNLETTLVAGLLWALFVLLLRPMTGTPARAGALGLAAGAGLLTKTVALAGAGVPAMAGGLWVLVTDRRRRLPALAFLAGFAAPAVWWFAPRVPVILGRLGRDASADAPNLMPWWFYLKGLVTQHAAGPLLAASVVAIATLDRRAVRSRVAWLAPLGGGLALALFLNALGTKRHVYFLAPYALLVAAACAAIAAAKAPVRRVLVPALAAVYAGIAVCSWFPQTAGIADLLALGTTRAPAFQNETIRTEDEAAAAIRQAIAPDEIARTMVVRARVPQQEVLVQLLILADPAWTLPGRFAPDRFALHGNEVDAAKIRRADVLVTFEHPDRPGPGAGALAEIGLDEPERDAAIRAAVDHVADRLALRARFDLGPDVSMAVYERTDKGADRAPGAASDTGVAGDSRQVVPSDNPE